MGAWGYGIFETDNAMDFVGDITDYICNNQLIKLENGKTTESGCWSPDSDGKLHHTISKQIYKKFSDIEKDIVLKYDFGIEERYLALCHILQMHDLKIPPKHLNKSIKIISKLLEENSDSDEYDMPLKRKNEVNNVLAKLKIQKLEAKLQKDLSEKEKTPTRKMKI